MDYIEIFIRLAVSLAAGFLIGLERGRCERAEPHDVENRITGIRTFGLIGLLGAVSMLLAEHAHWSILPVVFLGFAVLMTTSHVIASERDHDYGITTVIAALVTFVLGAVAMLGYITVTAAVAVVVTIVLGMKPVLHMVEEKLEQVELDATLKLLLISVVILPVLPDKGYGPWNALNPYTIWWMVVLIAAISYIGYFGTRIAGPRRGLMLTGLLGGLASSTAVTLNFSRVGREKSSLVSVVSASILVAAGIMYPRVLLVSSVVSRDVALKMAMPLIIMTITCLLAAFWLSRDKRQNVGEKEQPLRNPFELKVALQMAAVLALVMFLARGFQTWLGDTGIFILAALSGITDVDAINLTLSRMAMNEQLTIDVGAQAIIVASIMNTLTKGIMAGLIGGRQMFLRVGTALGITALIGTLLIL